MEPHNNNHQKITEKVLSTIETERLTPRGRWYFRTRNSMLWIPGIITTLLGAYTVAAIFYVITHIQWSAWVHIDRSMVPVLVVLMPLWWVISFGVFTLSTIYMVRKTTTGYRYSRSQLLLLSISGSIIIGMIFYTLIEKNNYPQGNLYRDSIEQHQSLWQNDY